MGGRRGSPPPGREGRGGGVGSGWRAQSSLTRAPGLGRFAAAGCGRVRLTLTDGMDRSDPQERERERGRVHGGGGDGDGREGAERDGRVFPSP